MPIKDGQVIYLKELLETVLQNSALITTGNPVKGALTLSIWILPNMVRVVRALHNRKPEIA